MKYFILFFSLFVQYMFAQLAQGPSTGFVPSGVIISTDSFPSVPKNPMTPHRSNPLHRMPITDIINEGGAAASLLMNTSNYVIDASVSGTSQIASPAILNSFPGIPKSDTSRPYPYDANIAAGPSHLAAVVNSSLRIFDKSGNSLKYIDIYDWYFRPGMPKVYLIGDPKIRYDHFAHRWIMVWLGINPTSDQNPTILPDSYFFISISDDANPLGTWYNWAILSSTNGNTDDGNWADFEGVGFDKDALYITSDQISFSTGQNMYAKIRIIPKAQLLANDADSLQWTDFWDIRNNFGSIMRGGSLRPSLVYGSPNEYYIIGLSGASVKDYFILYRLKDVLTTPTLTAVHIPVTPWITTPNAIQYEGGPLLESEWNYLTNEPVYKDSSLWVVHSTANPIATQYSNIRYLRFNTSTNTATEDISFGAVGYSYNYPSIMIDSLNNVGIICSRSGTTEYPGMYVTGRRFGDPPGLSPSIVLKAGEVNHLHLGSARNRWGDYSSIVPDPVDGTLLWASNGYATSSKSIWNTWIGKISMKPTSTANICVDRGMIGFGTIELDQKSLMQKIIISNGGFSPLQITNITCGPNFKIAYPDSFPRSIAQIDTIELQILFSPTKSGRCYDTITIFSNDPVKPQFAMLAVGVGVGPYVKAIPGTLYAVSGITDGGNLYAVNTLNGVPSFVGMTGILQLNSVCVHPKKKELFGYNNTGSVGGGAFYRISSDAAFIQKISVTNIQNLKGLAICNDSMAYTGAYSGAIYMVNIYNGELTLIGTNGSTQRPGGLALNPVNGTLWMSLRNTSGAVDNIYKLNRTTGLSMLVGSAGIGTAITDIVFDKNGTLFGLSGTGTATNTLIRIDTSSGVATVIGSLGKSDIQAIAIDSDVPVGVLQQNVNTIPTTFMLAQNYPNPFNPTTTIRYSLPLTANVKLAIYDLLGREIATLVNEEQSAGWKEVEWNAANYSSGIYFYKLEAGNYVDVKKLMLLK